MQHRLVMHKCRIFSLWYNKGYLFLETPNIALKSNYFYSNVTTLHSVLCLRKSVSKVILKAQIIILEKTKGRLLKPPP